MVKPAEHRCADNARKISGPFEHALYRNSLPNSLVRACEVEIAEAVLLQHVLEVPLAQDYDVIETVAPDAPEKSLANRIHERSLDRRPKNVDAGTGRGTVEVGAELVVVVADDELGARRRTVWLPGAAAPSTAPLGAALPRHARPVWC